jgi:serine/threonine-protein kinase
VLYESLTGRNPFQGPTLADTLGAILKDRPASVASLRPGTPGELARLLERLLSKSRDDRPASARVLLEELGRIAAPTPSPGGATGDAAPDRSTSSSPMAWPRS